MFRRNPDRFKSGIATVLVVLTLALNVAVPLLDMESERHTAFESDHAASCHVPMHDHSICVQFGNQQFSSGRITPVDSGLELIRLSVVEPSAVAFTAAPVFPAHPRAPPLPDRL